MSNSQYSPHEEASHGAGAIPTPDGGSQAAAGQPDQPTLYEFLTRLVDSPESRSEFDADPRAALDRAGFQDMTATDVQQATSLALDYAPVEVVTEYGRSLQSSVDNFAASTQHAAVSQLHPAQFEQEVTDLNMLHKAPEQKPDFSQGGDVDHQMPSKDTDVNVKQEDSHNLVNVHDVASGNDIANGIGNVADTGSSAVGDVTNTVDNTVSTVDNTASNVTDVAASAPSGVTDLAGDLPAVGDVAQGLGGGAETTGSHEPIGNDLPVVGDVTGALPDPASLPVAGPIAGPVVNDVAAPAVNDVAAPAVNEVAAPVTDVAGPVAAPVAAPVEDVAGPVLDTATSALPLDGVL